MVRLKTLSDIHVEGKRVLVRVDLNSDIRNKRVVPSERLTAPLKTIRELQKKHARIVLLAHQGRPGSDDFTSLKQHAAFLKNKISRFSFVNDVIGIKAIKAIAQLAPGHVLLLDNVRSVPDELQYEEKKPNKLVAQLAPLFDYYINDAFSASHRKQASIVGFPRVLPSAVGRVFQHELEAVEKLNVHNALLILGGVKPDDYLDLITNTRGKLLVTGYFGLLCLQAAGHKLGKQDEILKKFSTLLPQIKKILPRVILPVDVAVEVEKKRIDLPLETLPSNYLVYDVGKLTLKLYEKEIKGAKTIFLKGLPGLCNTVEFSYGTKTILLGVANSRAFSVVGGGHTLTFIEKYHLAKKFGSISLSGGALMYYLAHKTLPGIQALNK
jgi:phosphoglycerate kinase